MEVFSKLTFWYGLPHSELCGMPFSAIQKYMERLGRRQAEMRILMAETAMIPHISEEDRKSWMDDVMELIRDGAQVEAQAASPGVLGMIGIQVEKVK